ncbi:MAG: nitroreductase family protein [Chloroflexota bacterium]
MAVHHHLGLSSAIQGRRSIRHFTSEPVDVQLLVSLLGEACWAPSPHNSQPWRFTILSHVDERHALADAMAERLSADLSAQGHTAESIATKTEASRARITSAPAAILCSLDPDGLVVAGDQRLDDLEWQMAVQSVGAVLQTFFLLAAEHGLATCWMAAPMYCADIVRRVLRLPHGVVPQALVLVGKAGREGRIRARRPLDSVVDFR